MMNGTANIRKWSLLALALAFLGGAVLSSCSSSEEEDDCACDSSHPAYPDCCHTGDI